MTKLITTSVIVALVLSVISLIVSVSIYFKLDNLNLGAITRYTGPISSENGFIGGTASGSSFAGDLAVASGSQLNVGGGGDINALYVGSFSRNGQIGALAAVSATTGTFATDPLVPAGAACSIGLSSDTSTAATTLIYSMKVFTATGTGQYSIYNTASSSGPTLATGTMRYFCRY